MRSAASQHIEPIRGAPGRRVLNVGGLLQFLKGDIAVSADEPKQNGKGKKRAAPAAESNRHKRVKKESQEVAMPPPAEDSSTAIPVYKHTMEIEYTPVETRKKARGAKIDVVDPAQLEEERAFIEFIRDHPADGTTHDIGSIYVQLSGGEIVVSAATLGPLASFIMTVPHVDPDFDMDAHDMRAPYVRDPLAACTALRDAGRTEISATLHLVFPASPSVTDSAHKEVLPFRLVLEMEVALRVPAIFVPMPYSKKASISNLEEAQRRALSFIFPATDGATHTEARTIDIPLLYSSLKPAPRLEPLALEAHAQPALLKATLLPFQRRTVAWLLSREGKTLSRDAPGTAVGLPSAASPLPIFWQCITTEEGVWYYNRLTGHLTDVVPLEDEWSHGGILAEEPGLGKTLECIALVLLNPAIGREPTTKKWNSEASIDVKEIKTTLIVTPQSLAQQWADELTAHAPSLKVLVYDGYAKVPVPISERDLAIARAEKARAAHRANRHAQRRAASSVTDSTAYSTPVPIDVDNEADDGLVDWCTYINTFDVCITTYNVLQHELGVARPPPVRPRRTIATYYNVERSRSPLVMCEWYRVIMDEVQMVGGGKTEEMVSLIPRLSSFAVSGTPAKSQVSDLIHVLNFLRVQPFIDNQRLWGRLLKPGYAREFQELFDRYAVRTMKASVKDELTIPKQTRFLVPITLGKVEKHVYDQSFENALLELGLDARGVAVSGNWQIDTTMLRSWLRRLRGICTHPQVGQLQSMQDKSNALKTIGEVLQGMKDHNWRELMDNRKLKIQALTLLAQLQQRDENNPRRYLLALEILNHAETDANQLINDVKAEITEHHATKLALTGQSQSDAAAESSSNPVPGVRLGKERAVDELTTSSDDGEDEDIPRTVAGEEYKNKRLALQQRLRECQIAMHKVQFIKGDVYHVLGETYAEQENAAYAAAEELRRGLLKGSEHSARRAMELLVNDHDKTLTEEELLIPVPFLSLIGDRSTELMEEAHDMFEEVLNPQSKLLWNWRTHLIGLLTQPLTSGDEDADGQEYARSLETQGEAETYLQVYAALLADRREMMTSERTLLAALDVKEKKSRKTKAAHKAAAAALEEEVKVALADIELQPENQVLHKELHDQRKEILNNSEPGRAVRSILVDLNNVAARITVTTSPIKKSAADGVKKLREFIADQGKLMERMQADLAKLRKAFNERISYFRQLQEISDTVAEAEWEGSVQSAMANNDTERAQLDNKINTGRARQRYLQNLASAQAEAEDGEEEEDEICVLCRCEFTRGYVTPCAHVFCETCMQEWLDKKDGKACPICRVAIDRRQLQRFVVESTNVQAPKPLPLEKGAVPKSRRHIEYNIIEGSLFDDVKTMESHGSYGSKIQTLVQHLLYIQLIEPGAKSIVFSAWADSLHIITHALKANGISCLRIDQSRGKQNAAKKFRSDPTIQVLLLHGDRENAGLNVTCASRVFLVESVVHHAFEVQAIARIDRMGQTKPTEVFCYYAEDTVERNILDLAARQGLSLYTKDHSSGTLTGAAPITVPGKKSIDAPSNKARDKKGDFVFKTDDMLAIFFPHLFEELEYLLPDAELPPSQASSSQLSELSTQTSGIQLNAEAGPSRLG